MSDLTYTVRSLARIRGIGLVVIASLALGIAATTTMFSAAYAALLRPLPFADPDRLVLLFTTHTTPREGLVRTRWSRPLIDTLTASVTSYQSLASYTPSLVSLSGGAGDPEQVDAEIVSPEVLRNPAGHHRQRANIHARRRSRSRRVAGGSAQRQVVAATVRRRSLYHRTDRSNQRRAFDCRWNHARRLLWSE